MGLFEPSVIQLFSGRQKRKKKEKGNKVVTLTCWRVITTKSKEGKRSGCEEDKRETWQSLHGHPRMSLLSHSDSSSVTFNRADNCTDSSCHTFWKKKKVKSYLRPSLATGLVPQRWMGLKARVKTKRIGQITGISKVCVHSRVAAFLKITTRQMDWMDPVTLYYMAVAQFRGSPVWQVQSPAILQLPPFFPPLY